MKIGTNEVIQVMARNTEIGRIYQGTDLVYYKHIPDSSFGWISSYVPRNTSGNPYATYCVMWTKNPINNYDVQTYIGYSKIYEVRYKFRPLEDSEYIGEYTPEKVCVIFGPTSLRGNGTSYNLTLSTYYDVSTGSGYVRFDAGLINYTYVYVTTDYCPNINVQHVCKAYVTVTQDSSNYIVTPYLVVDGVTYSNSYTFDLSTDLSQFFDENTSYLQLFRGYVQYNPTYLIDHKDFDTRVDVCYLKVYDSNKKLEHSYTPVLYSVQNPSSNDYGRSGPAYYDSISGTFSCPYGWIAEPPQYLIVSDSDSDIQLKYIANGPDSDSSVKNVWFDTGVPIVNTSNLKVEIKTAAYRNNQAWPIGGINNASWAGFCVYAPYQGGGFGMYSIRINNRSVGVGNTNFTSNQAHVITAYLDTSDVNPSNSSQYRPVMIFDGTEYRSTEYGGKPNQGMNLFLFTRNLQSGQTISGSPSGLKIYYVKIWDNGTLIRHYKPVLHMSGYQYIPCFKDQVSGDYNYNLGTDSITYALND